MSKNKKQPLGVSNMAAAVLRHDAECVDEIARLATTELHVEFVWELKEWFSATEITLVMRALVKAEGLMAQKKKRSVRS